MDRLEFGRGIKGDFELGMLLKSAGELSLYYSCNKTLPVDLRASKALEPQPKVAFHLQKCVTAMGLTMPAPGTVSTDMFLPCWQHRGDLGAPLHHNEPLHRGI